jgi:glycosyltransferase involved in cell wall biosynthesis
MQKFSIILPVKNGGVYVKECVKSILSQTLQDFNLIVLDNCSTDGTLEWLQSLNDNRIIIHESRKALSIEENWARIKSIQKNEFITLIGHDDILNKNYLEIMNNLILKHPLASLYQTHFEYINANGEILRNCKPMDEIQYAHEFLAYFMCNAIDSTGTGYMMRSKDYDSLGGINTSFEKLIFADYALWIDLSLIGYKATAVEMAFKYRIHNSVSKITGAQEYQQAFEKFLKLIISHAEKNEKIKLITERYGRQMLMYYCESLSHRILKTPKKQREIVVKEFIEKCKYYAAILIPGQNFEPSKKFRIDVARILDSSTIGRNLFLTFNKLKS